jgi:hypothetical protein
VQVKYNSGHTFFVNSDHLVDVKFSGEIVKANKQKRSACLDE